MPIHKVIRKLKDAIQIFVVATNDLPVLKNIYRTLYQISVKIIVKYIKNFPEIKSIYLRGSMATGKFTPGISDIDLLIVLNDIDASAEQEFLGRFWKRYALIKIFFPQLGHIAIFCEHEIDKYLLFQIFVNFSKFYADLYSLRNIYGPYTLKLQDLNLFIKETPRDLLDIILLGDDYLKLIPGFYNLEFSINPKIYTKPLSRILHNPSADCFLLTNQIKEDFLLNSLFDAITIVDTQCRKKSYTQNTITKIALQNSRYSSRPATYDYVIKLTKPIAYDLFEKTKSCVESIVLSSEIGANYSYHFLIILKDGIDILTFKKNILLIKKFYERLNSPVKQYFTIGMDWPILLTKNMLISLGAVTPRTGYFYLLKHGTVLCGKNIIECLPIINQIANLTIKLFASEAKCLFTAPRENIADLADISYGTLPAVRLMLDKKIIATTPQEVFEEYLNNYCGEIETNTFKKYYNARALNPGKLPLNNKEIFKETYIFGKYCLTIIDKYIK